VPFYFPIAAVLFLIIFFSDLVTFLPNMVFGK